MRTTGLLCKQKLSAAKGIYTVLPSYRITHSKYEWKVNNAAVVLTFHRKSNEAAEKTMQFASGARLFSDSYVKCVSDKN